MHSGMPSSCLLNLSIFKVKFRFINYEFDICSFVDFQAFLRQFKISLSGR